MALETLNNVLEIGGFKVAVMDNLKKDKPELFRKDGSMHYEVFEKEFRPNFPVQIRHDKNSISFTIQNGPVKENGVNGCQVDTLIHAAKIIIEGLNEKFPCRENACAITKLDEAIQWLEHRKKKIENNVVLKEKINNEQ